MENKEKVDSWRELLQDKLNAYQPDGAVPDWQHFESRLSAGKAIKPYFGGLSGKLMIAAAGLLAVVLPAVYFWPSDSSETIGKTSQTYIQSSNQVTEKIDNQSIENVSDKSSVQSTETVSNRIVSSETTIQPTEATTTNENLTSNTATAQEMNKATKNDVGDKQAIDNPFTPDAGFTYSLSGNCVPVTVRCYPNVQSDSYFYVWTTSDGQSSNASNPKFRFENAGSYTIQLTVTSAQSKKSAELKQSHTFEVFPVPVSDFLVDIEDLNYHFRAKSLNASMYKWKIAELTVENEVEIDYAFVKSGTYPVQLTTTSDKGCLSETKKEIQVEIVHPIFIGNAFTPDADGNNDYFGPKSETLQDFNYRFEVYNRNGGVIFVSTDPDIQWDGMMNGTDKAPEGFYIYKIYTEDKYGNSQVKTGDVLLMRRK